MSRTALFDLLTRLIDDHDRRAGGGQLRVVPVLVDELDAVLPTLEAATRYAGGILLHPRASDLDGPVPAAPSPTLRATIEDRLSVRRVLEDFPLELVDDGSGRWSATVAGRLPEAANAADRELMSLAKSLIHRDLARREFGVVAYSETALDVFAQPAAWDLVTAGLRDPLISLGALRTLVVAVGVAAVSISRHCRPGGLDYALDRGKVRARNPPSDLPAQAGRLARAHRLIFYLGAGFSKSSHLPLGDELRDESMQRQLSSQLEDAALARAYFQWALGTRRLEGGPEGALDEDTFVKTVTLENVVRIEQRISRVPVPQTLLDFKDRHDGLVGRPGAAVRALGAMLDTSHRLVIVTVNFDELIEHNFPDAVRRFATEDDFESCPAYLRDYFAGDEDRVPVLKLHGTISAPASCLVTDVAIREGLSEAKRHSLAALVADGPVASWVYVGASMRDVDVVPVLKDRPFKADRIDERWAVPYPEPSIEAFVANREHDWLRSDVEPAQPRYITEFADAFLEALSAEWTRR